MLSLTRRDGDVVVIDGSIRVVLIKAKNGLAKIGIEAPKSVAVVREEILKKGGGEIGDFGAKRLL